MLPFLLFCQINKKEYCTIWLVVMWIFIHSLSMIHNISWSSSDVWFTEESLSSYLKTYWIKLDLLSKSRQNQRCVLFTCTTSCQGLSPRGPRLFWNALIVIVSMLSAALCRTEAVTVITTTGHAYLLCPWISSPLAKYFRGPIENSNADRHVWRSLQQLRGPIVKFYTAGNSFHSHSEAHKSQTVRREAKALLNSYQRWSRGLNESASAVRSLCVIQMGCRHWNLNQMQAKKRVNLKHLNTPCY